MLLGIINHYYLKYSFKQKKGVNYTDDLGSVKQLEITDVCPVKGAGEGELHKVSTFDVDPDHRITGYLFSCSN